MNKRIIIVIIAVIAFKGFIDIFFLNHSINLSILGFAVAIAGTANVDNVNFINNVVTGYNTGGALSITGSNSNIRNSNFERNRANSERLYNNPCPTKRSYFR